MIHLDTSFLIDLLREQSRGQVGPAGRWLRLEAASPLAVSVFVRCELEAGAAGASQPVPERERVRALLAAVATEYPGETFAARYGATLLQIQRSSKTVSTMDLLIAVTAMEARAPLVTGNRRHFDAVPGLDVLTYR